MARRETVAGLSRCVLVSVLVSVAVVLQKNWLEEETVPVLSRCVLVFV